MNSILKKTLNNWFSALNKKRPMLVLFLSLLGLPLFSQQINLVDKISSNYRDIKTFSMDINCQLDFVSTYQGPAFNSSGKIIKDGENYYTQIMGITSISNDKYQLMMDEGQQVIFMQNRAPLDYFQQFNVSFLSTEKLDDKYDFAFENNKKSILITIIPKNPSQYKEIKIRVNAKKYYLQEVHTYYNIEKNQVIASHIYYTNSKFGHQVDKDVFNIEKYVTVKVNKEILATSNYKKFKVVNYLKNELK